MNKQRLSAGFGWGVVATIAMSILMIIGLTTGMSPMPEPIPKAIVSKLFGEGMPTPLLMLLAIATHLGYGGVWGAIFAAWNQPVTLRKRHSAWSLFVAHYADRGPAVSWLGLFWIRHYPQDCRRYAYASPRIRCHARMARGPEK